MADETTTETAPATDNFHRPAAILSHANGVVVRLRLEGQDDIDILIADEARTQVLTALSHSLSDGDIKDFRALLGRQGR